MPEKRKRRASAPPGFLETCAIYLSQSHAPKPLRRRSRKSTSSRPSRRRSDAPKPSKRSVKEKDNDDAISCSSFGSDYCIECAGPHQESCRAGEQDPAPQPQSRWSYSSASIQPATRAAFLSRLMNLRGSSSNRNRNNEPPPEQQAPGVNPRHRMSYDPALDPLYANIPRRQGEHLPGEFVVHRQRDGEQGVRVDTYGSSNSGPKTSRESSRRSHHASTSAAKPHSTSLVPSQSRSRTRRSSEPAPPRPRPSSDPKRHAPSRRVRPPHPDAEPSPYVSDETQARISKWRKSVEPIPENVRVAPSLPDTSPSLASTAWPGASVLLGVGDGTVVPGDSISNVARRGDPPRRSRRLSRPH